MMEWEFCKSINFLISITSINSNGIYTSNDDTIHTTFNKKKKKKKKKGRVEKGNRVFL